ncbi:hypothetical protein E2553_41660 [Paraburkholderia dipogonis]|uniref:Uncharacterized protein n=1 Tax=Paraburkholderia dipogonis TaxID=1211383 RepID=A0A4Y8MKB0_9BURK|nr:hypothetical protein [Paraburkholderia dipogonis]TFE37869.1 hypothetical protein E2553_41660 [Paraburkholderia dipogonis]
MTVHLLIDSTVASTVVRGACSLLLHLPDVRAVRLAPLDMQSSVAFRDYVFTNLRNGAWPMRKRVVEHGPVVARR